MPLYEYECPIDGVFELVRKFSDPPLAACPKCGGPVEKLASAPAIQFKGTGWYITDYAKRSGTDAGKTDGSPSSSNESKGDSKRDSKSDSSNSGSSSSTSGDSSDKKSDKKS